MATISLNGDGDTRRWEIPSYGQSTTSAKSPDGTYAHSNFNTPDSYSISLWGDPIPDGPGYLNDTDVHTLEMSIRGGKVTRFVYGTGESHYLYSEEENYFYEDHYDWGFITITDPRLVHPIPDGGSTLPLAALSILGLTALRARFRR